MKRIKGQTENVAKMTIVKVWVQRTLPFPGELLELALELRALDADCVDEVNCSLASLPEAASLSLLDSLGGTAPLTCLSSFLLRWSSAAACCLRTAPFFRFTYHMV